MKFLHSLRRFMVLLLLMIFVLLGSSTLYAQTPTQAERYFAPTAFAVDNDAIWSYFHGRGDVDTFGYPTSRAFRFRGFEIQLFQRHVLQVVEGQVRPVNLLDPDLMPVTRLNQSTFPAHDPQVAAAAPPPGAPDYGQAVVQHLNQTVPNQWDGAAVAFRDYFLDAAPPGTANAALVALEIWGFPTSQPMRDPNNHDFVYQRFQRGIMHHDAATGVTRGILLGDAFKSLLTGQNLPPDLAQDLADSPFMGLYDPQAGQGLARTEERIDPPITTGNTNLAQAFAPVEAPPPPTPTPVPPAPTPAPDPASGSSIACARPPDDYSRLTVNGHVLNRRTYEMLRNAQALYDGPGDIMRITQGSYVNGPPASFGTHDGGGAVDISIRHPQTNQFLSGEADAMVRALRLAGFAAWFRPADDTSPGTAPHIHAIAAGDRELSEEAQGQLTGSHGYFYGRNGLPQPQWAGPDPHGGPIVCDWMRELGYDDWS